MFCKRVSQSSKLSQASRLLLGFSLVALSVAAVAQNAWYWTQLPNRVAMHFDLQGRPDNWMDKTSAAVAMLAAQLGLPWFMVGVACLTRYLPASLINIPRREYWLHSDHREASLAYIRYWMSWVAVTVFLFMMSINHLTYVANVRGAPLNLPAFGTVLVLYLVAIVLLVGAMLRRFRTRLDR